MTIPLWLALAVVAVSIAAIDIAYRAGYRRAIALWYLTVERRNDATAALPKDNARRSEAPTTKREIPGERDGSAS